MKVNKQNKLLKRRLVLSNRTRQAQVWKYYKLVTQVKLWSGIGLVWLIVLCLFFWKHVYVRCFPSVGQRNVKDGTTNLFKTLVIDLINLEEDIWNVLSLSHTKSKSKTEQLIQLCQSSLSSLSSCLGTVPILTQNDSPLPHVRTHTPPQSPHVPLFATIYQFSVTDSFFNIIGKSYLAGNL